MYRVTVSTVVNLSIFVTKLPAHAQMACMHTFNDTHIGNSIDHIIRLLASLANYACASVLADQIIMTRPQVQAHRFS